MPALKAMVERFKTKFKYTPDHNAIKGYTAAWVLKYATELVGKPDSKAIAAKLHGLTLKASEYPGVLMDVSWDDTGEMSRESFFVKVENGKQVVEAILPPN